MFRSAFVFADSQTDPLPGVEPAPIEPPCEPLTGDARRHVLKRLQAFARHRIVVDAGRPANAQVRVLVHELAHALGIGYERFGRARDEVIVDSVIFSPCQGRSPDSTWL